MLLRTLFATPSNSGNAHHHFTVSQVAGLLDTKKFSDLSQFPLENPPMHSVLLSHMHLVHDVMLITQKSRTFFLLLSPVTA